MGYFPNGTSGMDYEAKYCDHCVHQFGPDGTSGCAIWLAHMIHNYDEANNDSSILDLLIPRSKETGYNARCELFRPGASPNGGEPVPELTETDKKYMAWQNEQRTTKTDGPEPANLPGRKEEVA